MHANVGGKVGDYSTLAKESSWLRMLILKQWLHYLDSMHAYTKQFFLHALFPFVNFKHLVSLVMYASISKYRTTLVNFGVAGLGL